MTYKDLLKYSPNELLRFMSHSISAKAYCLPQWYPAAVQTCEIVDGNKLKVVAVSNELTLRACTFTMMIYEKQTNLPLSITGPYTKRAGYGMAVTVIYTFKDVQQALEVENE